MIEAAKITIKGVVQGVGFRPFIYKLAIEHNLLGWVLNSKEGVFVHVEGAPDEIDAFVLDVSEKAPAASKVNEINIADIEVAGYDSFEIHFSEDSGASRRTLVSPDLATCDDCAKELFDKNSAKYGYPFINCTNCGPRFTIIKDLPYDRPKTAMAPFDMCEPCAAEYANPLDRRFHAQPTACFNCGPHAYFSSKEDNFASKFWGTDASTTAQIIGKCASLLQDGEVIAVKGLGGFHLVCDASNAKAVATLRTRKRRPSKPLAVMFRNIKDVEGCCSVNDIEAGELQGSVRPIVLLKKTTALVASDEMQGIADGMSELGVMLPYTPLQHLLLEAVDFPLVMTSGNIHGEPIVISDEDARIKLGDIAVAIIGSNREIITRFDDSVVRVLQFNFSGEKPEYALTVIRRARGMAPMPIALPGEVLNSANAEASEGSGVGAEDSSKSATSIFAVGPQQKNTFCLTRGGEAFLSAHIGDMDSSENFFAWDVSRKNYEHLFDQKPTIIACDAHPDYITSKWARDLCRANPDLKLAEVWHHHAHIVSTMAENSLKPPVLGFAFDGTGYGPDGAIWGGEALLCNYETFERFANMSYVPMPGGSAAIKDLRQMAYGVLWAYDLLEHPGAAGLLEKLGEAANICEKMIDNSINTPFTSSVGRLFDAAACLLGLCDKPNYEGEGAILLEGAIEPLAVAEGEYAPSFLDSRNQGYVLNVEKNTATKNSTALDTSVVLLDPAPLFEALLGDLVSGEKAGVIARKFHDAFVGSLLDISTLVKANYDIKSVALGGGVFMNRYLVENSVLALVSAGFDVAIPRELPANDGGVSYGQAVIGLANNKS